MAAGTSRPEILASTFGELGMPASAADALSADLVLRHPMTRRCGVRRMQRTLHERGLAPERAAETASMLYALESFDLGHCLAEVRSELRLAGVAEDCAVGAVFQAARLHRESAEPGASGASKPQLARLIGGSLTFYTVAVALWLLLDR